MIEDLQLALFASSESRSSCESPSSPRSSELPTSSSDESKNATIGASDTRSTRRASASSPRAGAATAGSSQPGAKLTVVSAAQPTLPIFTELRRTETAELAIPRPLALSQCARGEEARPCPWVSCRHHLLLEVAQANPRARGDRRPTSLRLNMLTRTRRKNGRRPGLASSAAAAVVRQWIDDAVELLSRLEYTCTWDYVHDHPDGVEAHELADVLGVSEQLIDAETREAYAHYLAECEAQGVDVRELLR